MIFLLYQFSLLKSTGSGTSLSTFNLFTLLFKLLKLLGIFFNLLISYLSTSDLKLAKSTFLENFDESTLIAFFKPVLVHSLANLIKLSHLILNILAL